MNKYDKNDNESLLDYYKRITDLRKDLDLDYSEWAKIITGKEYSSENGRKMYYGIKAMFDNLEESEIESVGDKYLLTKLEEKEVEIKKERRKLNDVRTKLNRLINASARRENNLEYISSSIEELKEIKPFEVDLTEELNDNEAVLNFSDFHLGAMVDNYFNKYDQNIAIERINKLANEVIINCKRNNVTKLHVAINGDLINGFKHLSLIKNADLSVAESITIASELISNMIYLLCKEINRVELYFAIGNHAVMKRANEECLERDNFEFLIFDFIKLRTEGCKNLTIHKNKYSDDIIDIRIGKKLIVAMHGHKDKPKNCSQKLATFLDEKPDYILLGHYHHYEEYDQNNINVKVNGSIMSTDDYAFGLRLNSNPYQILVIHDKNGEEICTYKIKLNN